MQWMTGPEPPEQPSNPLAPLLIEDLIEEFIQDRDSIVSKAKVTKEQILWLADQTKGQQNNALWGRYRILRFTGSNFGDVIKAHSMKQKSSIPIPPLLLKKLRGEHSFHTKDSILWGKMQEKIAMESYMDQTGNIVEECGIFCFPVGF